MINYSIYPEDVIFEDMDNFYPEYEILEISSELKIQIERINNKEVKVVKIISTNPGYYLNQKFTPGSVLKSKLYI